MLTCRNESIYCQNCCRKQRFSRCILCHSIFVKIIQVYIVIFVDKKTLFLQREPRKIYRPPMKKKSYSLASFAIVKLWRRSSSIASDSRRLGSLGAHFQMDVMRVLWRSFLINWFCSQNISGVPAPQIALVCRVMKRGRGFDYVFQSEGEVAFFSAKRWDRRNRADLIESATPCHDAQVAGLYWNSNPLRLTVLAAMSEDYTTAPQHLHRVLKPQLH